MKRLVLIALLLVACNTYEDEYIAAQEEIELQGANINSLRGRVTELSQDNNSLLVTISELNETLEGLIQDIRMLTEENNVLGLTIEELELQKEALEAQIEELLAEIESLSQEIQENLSLISDLNGQIDNLNTQLDNSSSQIEQLEITIANLQSRNLELSSSIERYRGVIAGLSQQIQDFVPEIREVPSTDVLDALEEKGITRASHLVVGIRMYSAGISLDDITQETINAVIKAAGFDPTSYKKSGRTTVLDEEGILRAISPDDFVVQSTYLGGHLPGSEALGRLNVTLPNAFSDYDVYVVQLYGDSTDEYGKFEGTDGGNLDSYPNVDDETAEILLDLALEYGLLKVVFYNQDGETLAEYTPNEYGEFVGMRQYTGNEFSYIALPNDLSEGGDGEWILAQVEFIIGASGDIIDAKSARLRTRSVGGTRGKGSRPIRRRRV